MDIRQPQRNIREEQGRDDITAAWTIYSKRPRLDAIRAAFNHNVHATQNQPFAKGFGTKGE